MARREFFLLVAERLGTRMLEASEARLFSSWFLRLAVGEPPNRVFAAPRGRPRKVRDADDYDIAWFVHYLLETLRIQRAQKTPRKLRTIPFDNKRDVYAAVARGYDLRARTVANIYSRLRVEIAPLAAANPDFLRSLKVHKK